MVIDISQELFGCVVFPGDPAPVRKSILSIKNGDGCNLTELSLCAHNGTHIDAPYHFLSNGKTVDQLPPEVFAGPAYVCSHQGEVTERDAVRMLSLAAQAGAGERLLIAGDAVVTAQAARIFAGAGLKLIGNESQTFGPPEAPAEVHRILLGAEVVLLEGIRLQNVPEGRYLLCAAPLNLGGCDGAPCRAVLMTAE